jgi:hypothetical protein
MAMTDDLDVVDELQLDPMYEKQLLRMVADLAALGRAHSLSRPVDDTLRAVNAIVVATLHDFDGLRL